MLSGKLSISEVIVSITSRLVTTSKRVVIVSLLSARNSPVAAASLKDITPEEDVVAPDKPAKLVKELTICPVTA